MATKKKKTMNTEMQTTTKTDTHVAFGVVVGMITAFSIGFGFIGLLSRLIKPVDTIPIVSSCTTYAFPSEQLGTLGATEVALHQATVELTSAIQSNATSRQLATLADARKKLMIDMLQIDPNTAKNYLLNEEDRVALSQKTTNCAETSYTYSGDVVTTIIEREDIATADILFTTGAETLHLALTNLTLLRNNQAIVSISGYKIDNLVFVDSNQNENFSYLSPDEKSATPWIGVQPLIFVKFTAPDLYDISITDEQIMTALNQANEYYKENSLGQFSYAGLQNTAAVADIRTIRSTQPVGCDDYSYSKIMEQAVALTPTEGKTPTVVVLYHFPPDTCGRGYTQANAGLSTYGTKQVYPIWVSHNYFFDDGGYSIDWMGEVIAHEMGHTLGNYHAGLYNHNIFTTPFNATTCRPQGGYSNSQLGLTYDTTDEVYGDHFDIMGRYGMGNFNAFHKKKTGWHNDTSFVTVIDDGNYRLGPTEFSVDETDYDLRALQIPRSKDGKEYLYVEFRTPQGFDQIMPVPFRDTLEVVPSNVYEGALLHIEYPCTTSSNWGNGRIIDPYDEVPGVNYVNPALLPGDTFTDPKTGVQVKVTGINKASVGNYQDAWLDVQVTYPKKPSIVSPLDGDIVNNSFEFSTDVFQGTGQEEIEYFVNDVLITTTTDRTVTIDTSSYADESTLTLKARAKGTELESTARVLVEKCASGSYCSKAYSLYWKPMQTVTISQAVGYTISFQAKKGTADDARIFIGNETWNTNCWAEELTDTWTSKTCEFTYPGTSGQSAEVAVRILSGGGSGAADNSIFSYVDDIAIHLNGELPKDSVLINGGFEEQGTAWWLGDDSSFAPLVQSSPNRQCGNINGVGSVDVADLTYMTSFMFKSGPIPFPRYVANVNGSPTGIIDVADLTYFVAYQFKGGPAPTCFSENQSYLPLGSNWSDEDFTEWYNSLSQ